MFIHWQFRTQLAAAHTALAAARIGKGARTNLKPVTNGTGNYKRTDYCVVINVKRRNECSTPLEIAQM